MNLDKKVFEQRKKIIYDFICDELYVPMRLKDIAQILMVSRQDRDDLKMILDDLVNDGKIELSSKGKYVKTAHNKQAGKNDISREYPLINNREKSKKNDKKISEENLLTGIYESSSRGFGFVNVEGQEEDIYISAKDTGNAMHGDLVEFVILRNPHGKRQEGKILRILQHNTKELVGTFDKATSFGFVIPDNPRYSRDIFVSKERSKGCESGMKVVVKITDYGNDKKKPEGIISEILGRADEAGTDILSIIKGYELPLEFPEKVLNQATNVAKDVSDADRAGRMDLRHLLTVTIDGEDARDLDDAITISKENDVYTLGVHIADVTNYVQEHSALDVEALKRGTSVYLTDRVIPMLPRALSNGICSLNQGEDRLALSCIMTIDSKGNIIDHTIAETVINVDARMTYTSVKKILADKDIVEIEKYRDFVDDFKLMEELSAILREKRYKRGAIDFDFPESKIILDDNGRAVDIKPYERNVATNLIEDFMLAANETVAEDYFWQEIPFVYRIHDIPDQEKIKKLAIFINNFGYSLKASNEEIHPKELQKLLLKIQGTPSESLISRLVLRSMKQAKYATTSNGHFGLAAKYYCHFTSPIRRYPDLQIHRIIKDSLRGRLNDDKRAHYDRILPDVAKQSSELERRAEEAERETDKQKKAEYSINHIGEEYEGIISGMNAYGIYVELPNTLEGMVHVTSLKDDYYNYDEEHFEMVGERTNKRYKLGQSVRIIIKSADLLRRTIDFEFVNNKKKNVNR